MKYSLMEKKKYPVLIRILKSKYLIASIIFVLWILFFDEYSVMSFNKNKVKLKNLVEQQNFYKEKIKSDQQKLMELNSGKEELEKYAREQFNMSKPGEDLYVIINE
jgi:cell division protein DivIC